MSEILYMQSSAFKNGIRLYGTTDTVPQPKQLELITINDVEFDRKSFRKQYVLSLGFDEANQFSLIGKDHVKAFLKQAIGPQKEDFGDYIVRAVEHLYWRNIWAHLHQRDVLALQGRNFKTPRYIAQDITDQFSTTEPL